MKVVVFHLRRAGTDATTARTAALGRRDDDAERRERASRANRYGGEYAGTVSSASHLCYTSHVSLHCQTRVKLNRVFFPR